jgi:hypothetical protein
VEEVNDLIEDIKDDELLEAVVVASYKVEEIKKRMII